MPTANVVQVADAVVVLLGATVLAEDVDAVIERSYVPVRDLAESETLLVSVVPGVGESGPDARRVRRRTYKVGVAVQQRVPRDLLTPSDKRTWLDGKLLFVETLQAILEDNHLDAAGEAAAYPLDAVPVLVEVDTLYLPDELEEDRVFAAEIFATYRTERNQ